MKARTLYAAVPRVLVVEDDPQALAYVGEIFRLWGWTVDAVMTGQQALARVDDNCPDLIISDLVLPGMSGLELMTALRQQRSDCVVFFVLVTGYGTVTRAVSAIDAGADEVLLKPFNDEDVRLLLERNGFPVDVRGKEAGDGRTAARGDRAGGGT
jgi:CheY-like chemotaxis protein